METTISKKSSVWSRQCRLALCLLFTAAFPAPALAQTGSDGNPADAPNAEVVRPALDDGPSLKLIKNYLTVTGGRQTHLQLRNVRATGMIKEAGKERQFEVIETLDGRRHITYSWKVLGRPHQTVYAFDGVTVWKQDVLPKKRPPDELRGAEAAYFKNHRWFIQPFLVPLRAEYVFNYQAPGKVSGRPAHVIVGYGKDNERSWFYFDQETFLLTRWGGFGPVAGIRQYLDYRTTRYRKVDGVLLPAQIDLLVGESPFGSITFDSIKANAPVDLSMFHMPPDNLPTLRQAPVRQ